MTTRKTAILLFAVAFVFRTINYLAFSEHLIVGSDQINNILLARRLAAGDFSGVLDRYWTPLYPILIGSITNLTDSIILPSLIISLFASSLAVPLVYYLTKQFYSNKEAIIAAIIAVFYPHLINSFFGIGTENIYLLILIGAILTGWKALRKSSRSFYLLTGILLGLAYLTRPEAFAYPLFFVVVKIGRDLWTGNGFGSNSKKQIAVLLLGFMIFAAPYLIFLRSATGGWTISGKAEVNTIVGEPLDEGDGFDTSQGEEKFQYDSIRQIIKYFVHNLIIVHKNFTNLVPLMLVGFMVIGLFGEPWSRERFYREVYLILFVLMTVVGYALAVVQTRYFYVLLPIFFVWIAHGMIKFEKWFRNTLKKLFPERQFEINSWAFAAVILLFIYIQVLPINIFMRSTLKESAGYAEREAGLWLKSHGKPAPLVFSATMRPVFYAEGTQLPPKTQNLDEIFAEIKNKQVDYVVFTVNSLERNPYLKDLPKKLQESPEFELIYAKQQNDNKVLIYRQNK